MRRRPKNSTKIGTGPPMCSFTFSGVSVSTLETAPGLPAAFGTADGDFGAVTVRPAFALRNATIADAVFEDVYSSYRPLAFAGNQSKVG